MKQFSLRKFLRPPSKKRLEQMPPEVRAVYEAAWAKIKNVSQINALLKRCCTIQQRKLRLEKQLAALSPKGVRHGNCAETRAERRALRSKITALTKLLAEDYAKVQQLRQVPL